MFSLLQILGALASILALCVMAYEIGYKKGEKSIGSPQNRKTEQLRMNKIYAPLRKLLIDTHISSCQSIMYPYFRLRFKRAYPYLKQRAFRKFYKTLCDKGISKRITGVDFGHFPLESIEKIIKDNIIWCDSKLVSLLQDVLRTKYENPHKEDWELDDGDMKLIDHIYDGYDMLNKKLISNVSKE